MRRILSVVLAACMAGSLLAIPAQAKKKAGGSKSRNFYLRWDDDGAGGCGANYMSVVDSPDSGNGCWFIFQPAQEVLVATTGAPLTQEWTAADGLPLVLDAKKNLTGELTVNARGSTATTMEVKVSSDRGSLGEASIAFESTPVSPKQTLALDIDIARRMHRKKITSLTLSTTIRGTMILGWVELDSPPSFITVPTRN